MQKHPCSPNLQPVTGLIDPTNYFNILDAVCKMVRPTIDLENHRRAHEGAGAKTPPASDKSRK
jgi:hypothetical protein